MSYIEKKLKELNFESWFEKTYPKEKRSKGNWFFNVSVHHPDDVLTKGKHELVISLNGLGMPMPIKIVTETDEEGNTFCKTVNMYEELLELASCKYIALIYDKEVIYETWTGELPTNKVVDEWLSMR